MITKAHNHPESLEAIMNRPDNNVLSPLFNHINLLNQLQNQLNLMLESPLINHCRVCNFSGDTLTLQTDSPAWAARLRYNIPLILQHFKTNCQLISLKTIRIKVNPEDTGNSVKKYNKPLLSGHSANLIKQVADSINDNELRNSLYKIASHTDK